MIILVKHSIVLITLTFYFIFQAIDSFIPPLPRNSIFFKARLLEYHFLDFIFFTCFEQDLTFSQCFSSCCLLYLNFLVNLVQFRSLTFCY